MSDKSDKLANVAICAPIVQAVLTAVIALSSGWWAYTTYKNDQKRWDREQNRELYEAQEEVIAQMSRQLGLMEAQCKDNEQILDSKLAEKTTLLALEEGCLDAYLGVRSFFFLARTRISPSPKVGESTWNEKWKNLEESLKNAGNVQYEALKVSRLWQDIIDNSKGHGH